MIFSLQEQYTSVILCFLHLESTLGKQENMQSFVEFLNCTDLTKDDSKLVLMAVLKLCPP